MTTVEYTYWHDGDTFLGFLNDHPDYWTQGENKQELIESLKDIFMDIVFDEVPFIRTVELGYCHVPRPRWRRVWRS